MSKNENLRFGPKNKSEQQSKAENYGEFSEAIFEDEILKTAAKDAIFESEKIENISKLNFEKQLPFSNETSEGNSSSTTDDQKTSGKTTSKVKKY